MTSVHRSRYALFYHRGHHMKKPLTWRRTPRSKQYVSIVPPTTLPGLATVVAALRGKISIRISETQQRALREWTGALPESVLCPTACDTGTIVHVGPYTVINPAMHAVQKVPEPGDTVLVRITASVRRLGPIYKTVVQVVDVLCTDVAAAEDARTM